MDWHISEKVKSASRIFLHIPRFSCLKSVHEVWGKLHIWQIASDPCLLVKICVASMKLLTSNCRRAVEYQLVLFECFWAAPTIRHVPETYVHDTFISFRNHPTSLHPAELAELFVFTFFACFWICMAVCWESMINVSVRTSSYSTIVAGSSLFVLMSVTVSSPFARNYRRVNSLQLLSYWLSLHRSRSLIRCIHIL